MKLLDEGDGRAAGHGAPHLRPHVDLAVAEKMFDAQVLPDPLEEQLDLPATLVGHGDHQRRQCRAQRPDFNAVLASLGADAPRGDLPRAFVGEQNYWTLVGVDGGGERSGLISEDGALEVGRSVVRASG